MSLAVVGPMERQDLALAAARQQQEADGGGLKRPAVFIRGESCGQSTELVVGQESLAPLAAVASDALAGVNGGVKMYRRGGVKMYCGLGGSLSP